MVADETPAHDQLAAHPQTSFTDVPSRKLAPRIWKRPGVARLLAENATASTARWSYNVGLPAYIYARTHSASFIALVTVVRYLPPLLLTPLTSQIVRSTRRRAIFVACDALAAAIVVTMAAIDRTSDRTAVPIAVVLALTALCSTATRSRAPLASTTLLDLVDEDGIVGANVASQMTESVAVIVGPLIAAGLLAWSGTFAVFDFTGAMFALSALLAATVEPGQRSVRRATKRASLWSGLRAGFIEVQRTSSSRVFTSFAIGPSTLLGVDTVLLVVFANDRLSDGTSDYGLLLAAIGLGGLVGAVVTNRIGATRRPAQTLVLTSICCALPTIALVPVHTAGTAFVIEVVSGIGATATATLASVGFQRSVPPRGLAHAIPAFLTVLLLGLVLGAAVTPLLVDGAGLDTTLVVTGVAWPVIALTCLPRLRRLDEAGRSGLDLLAGRVAVLERLALFERARRPTLERLASAMSELHYHAGTVVIVEGDRPDAFYALVDGEVSITKSDASSDSAPRARQVARLKGPDFFGEIGLMRHIPRTATVETLTECTVLRVDGEEFLAALAEGSATSMLLETAEMRLDELDDRTMPT